MKASLSIAFLVLSFSLSSLAFADDDERYWQTIDSIKHELSLPMQGGDAAAIQERRQRLRQHFSTIPPQYAGHLYDRLFDGTDELSPLFNGRLATARQEELLWILFDLDAAWVEAGGTNVNPVNNQPQFFSDSSPLPATANAIYRDAFANLRGALNDEPETGGHREREQCWLDKLEKANVDDRIIKWETICPRTSMASSPFVTSCNVQFHNVPEGDLFSHIKEKEDVELANNSLFFITYIRPGILTSENFGSFQAMNFRQDVAESWKAIDTLDKMANAMGLGAGSAMPVYFRAIAGWIGERQADSRSVLSCR